MGRDVGPCPFFGRVRENRSDGSAARVRWPAGLADRQTTPGNRREILSRLTDEGRRAVADVMARRRAELPVLARRKGPVGGSEPRPGRPAVADPRELSVGGAAEAGLRGLRASSTTSVRSRR